MITVNSTVGLQALFHAVPTKTMGDTFYNLEGLTDQKPLDRFWCDPQPSDRALLSLLQPSGAHHAGEWQFRWRLPFPHHISDRSGSPSASPTPMLPTPSSGKLRNPVLLLGRLLARLTWAGLGFTLLGLQLPAMLLRRPDWAAALMTMASSVALRALGIQVVVDDSQPRNRPAAFGAHLQSPQPL